MWRVLQHDKPEDFVIATGAMHSLQEFVEKVFAAVGLSASDHVDSDPALLRPSDITYSVGNPEKSKRLLGWQATVEFDCLIERLVRAEQERAES
jgi:GDPmannose 4,6-dehydratase